jgi:hypothetical protein
MQAEVYEQKKVGSAIYLKLVKFWLVSILVILPFQLKIADYIAQWSSKLSSIINYLDELTAVIFLFLSFGEYYKNRKSLDKSFFFYSLLFCLVFVDWHPDSSMATLFK